MNTLPLKYTTPEEELYSKLKGEYPSLPDDYKCLTFISNEVGTDKNAKIKFVVDSTYGITGSISIEIDLLEMNKYINDFIGVNKVPKIYVNMVPGSTIKLSDILPIINKVLGTNLTMSGKYPDIVEHSFVVPEKGQSVAVSLVGGVGSGGAGFSLRLASVNGGSLLLQNRGSVFTDSVITRSLNPYIATDGSVVWTLDKQLVGSPATSPFLALYDADFSDVFGFDQTQDVVDTSYFYEYNNFSNILGLTDYFREKINAKFASLGLPAMPAGKAAYKTRTAISSANKYLKDADNVSAYTHRSLTASPRAVGPDGTPGGTIHATIKPRINTKYTYMIAFINPWKTYTNAQLAALTNASDKYADDFIYLHYNLV